jgi:hypothetical protein
MQSTQSNIKKFVKVWRGENLIDYVLKDLERRVKRDKPVKLSVFFTGLSAYTREPINLVVRGESGSGKTYNTVETLRYFPKEDVWFLGGLSPKALIHQFGVLVDKYGEPINLEDKPIKPRKEDYESEEEFKEALKQYRQELKLWGEKLREGYTLISLRNKILVFLEAPDPETFKMLYPILSHDTERIEYRFTDKTSKGSLRTVKVVIEGFFAAIFLTTERYYMEEFSTRCFTVTPETSKEKIEEANKLTNLKASLPWQYNEETEETKCIKALIEGLKRELIDCKTDVVIPFLNLHELFPKEMTRDMRDFQHFTQLLKVITLLHLNQRPFIKIDDNRFFVSTVEDVKRALEIYSELFLTTRTGIGERILKIYHEIVKTKEAWYLQELTDKINEVSVKKVSSDWVRKVLLQRLMDIGYVTEEVDSEDKRFRVFKPLVKEEVELSEIHRFLDSPTILSSKLEEGFRKWLENNIGKEGLEIKRKFFAYKTLDAEKAIWGETEISMEEFQRRVLSETSPKVSENFSFNSKQISPTSFSKPKESSDSEKKLGISGKTNFPRSSDNSEAECLKKANCSNLTKLNKSEICGLCGNLGNLYSVIEHE